MSTLCSCARCGRNHEGNIVWHRFQRPIEDEDGAVWTHWATCPQTGDPVLMRSE